MGDDRVPEPAELHAHLSRDHPLDWGDVPSRDEIGAKYGGKATARSLALLVAAAQVEPHITADVTNAVGAEGFMYQLKNRLKSPQSLARKIKMEHHLAPPFTGPDDVLRYTVGVDHPDQVVQAARRLVDRMKARGWSIESAHHSYVKNSRYKGLHTFFRGYGQLIEVQVHSRQSLAVKEQTTKPYEIVRDREQPKAARDTSEDFCIARSDSMAQPAGIDALEDLGGVPVEVRRYVRQAGKAARTAKEALPGMQNGQQRRPERRRDNDGRDESGR